MGLKKYEIITVGSDKRVRALRSWQVGDRYVNIGDVGGIVYDEKTLSQDGACWLFRGNFGFPGARIGGDSIVDVGEAALSATGTPAVDILGSSVVVGSKIVFEAEQTAADAVVLTAADFEQGSFNAPIAGNPLTGLDSPTYIRTKNPIFAGGKTKTLKCEVPGFVITAVALDRDGLVITSALATATGEGVTITVPAGQYFSLTMTKDQTGPTVPADATTAQITFTGTYETKLSVIDSRVEVNPANATGTTVILPGGTYTIAPGAKYPEAVIRNSKVSLSVSNTYARLCRIMGQIIGSTAVLDANAGNITVAGIYSNVKNLMASGVISTDLGVTVYSAIQATDCNDFSVSPTIFPGLAAAQTANMPFIFQGCNVPNGIFYHHAQIANTYRDINFDLATADLGKPIGGDLGKILVSSEVNGMYRGYGKSLSLMGTLIESVASVEKAVLTINDDSYATTIYKDAYFNGIFSFEGTNVFGNAMKHEASNTQNVLAVQGTVNAFTVGAVITGIAAAANRVVVAEPFRINGSLAFTVNNDTTIETKMLTVDLSGKIINLTSWAAGTRSLSAYANTIATKVYIVFRKAADAPITPDDVKGITVTTYNGCRIVNTGETAVPMKGNIRVEDNATLVNASVTGSGYFGGNAVASGLRIGGAAFMSDNASFVKTGGTANIRNLKMTDNAKAVIGDVVITGSVHIKDNAVFTPTNLYVAEADFYLQDNAKVTADVSVNGSLLLKDNAAVNRTLTIVGCITLCGSYNQTAAKTWTGKRVIDNENAPKYDNNVKTQYDF